KEDFARFLLRIKHERGTTVLWVEHDLEMVADLADRVTVLDFGQVIAEGPPAEALSAPPVVEAYLGRRPYDDSVAEAADVGGGQPRTARLGVAGPRGDGAGPAGTVRPARADGGRDTGRARRSGARGRGRREHGRDDARALHHRLLRPHHGHQDP